MVNVNSPVPPEAGTPLPAPQPRPDLFPFHPVAVGPRGDPEVANPPRKRAERPVAEKKLTSEAPHLAREDLQRRLKEMNRVMEGVNARLQFDLYDGTDQLYVQVIDRSTNHVVKTLPQMEFLELSSRIQNAVGMILDKAI